MYNEISTIKGKSINFFYIQFFYSALFITLGYILIHFVGLTNISLYNLVWINNINFIILQLILRKRMNSYLNPLSLYSIILFLFSSGQLILYSLNIDIETFNIFERLNEYSIKEAIVFIILAYIFYELRSSLIVRKNNIFSLGKYEDRNINNSQSIYTIGIFLVSIGIIPYFIGIYENLSIVLNEGYRAYYQEGARSDFVLSGLSYFLFSGLAFVITGGKKRKQVCAILFLVSIAIIRFLSGDRGDGIVFSLTAYMYYIYFIRKGKSNGLQFLLIALILMSFIPTIGALRNNRDESFFRVLLDSNIVASTLSNLGATIWPLVRVMDIVPSTQNFIYGRSYLASLVFLIPSPLRLGGMSELIDNWLYSSPARWLQNTLNMSYGPGFTPFAESYLNFGWWGIVAMAVFGMITAYFFTRKFNTDKGTTLSMGLNILSFQLLAMSSRGSFNNMVAFYIRYVLFPLFLLLIYQSYLRNKYNRRI